MTFRQMPQVLGMGVLLLASWGCASVAPEGHEGASMAVTHEWIATNRVAMLHFDENNADCIQQATRSVEQYETCMNQRGYESHRD